MADFMEFKEQASWLTGHKQEIQIREIQRTRLTHQNAEVGIRISFLCLH